MASNTGESTTFSAGSTDGPPDVRFIHYNDVYHVEAGSREPVGGIARFQSVCNHYATHEDFASLPELLTFFSGDAFNPSLESSVTKGSHMVPILNGTNISAACLGNHDLDFGIPQFRYLATQCTFPWLCANVLDPALGTDVPIGNCQRTLMLTSSNGIKVGIIGLVEREWLETLNSLPPNIDYRSATATALELVPKLRAEGAEFIVAVTHQRQPNDEKLAHKLPPGFIDIILGGHDHTYEHSIINDMHLLRSGTDFKNLSYIEARRQLSPSRSWNLTIRRRDIISTLPEDPATLSTVSALTSTLATKMNKPIGYTTVPLDARFTTVRLQESNYANFVCDLMRLHYSADCCIMAAGTLRGDQVYPAGVLKVKDIMNCFPFEDPCVVVAVTGKAIVAALENGVSKYPALEGRFPQVSGVTFAFDPALPEGKRCSDVRMHRKPIDVERKYTLCTRDYMVRGKDGFNSLLLKSDGGEAESIVSEENGLLLSTLLRQYFMSLKVLGRWKKWGASMGRHWGGVQDQLHSVHPVQKARPASTQGPSAEEITSNDTIEVPSLVGHAQDATDESSTQHPADPDSEDEDDLPAVPISLSEDERKAILMRKFLRKWWKLAGLQGHPGMFESADGEGEGCNWTRGICPRVEGRIVCLGESG